MYLFQRLSLICNMLEYFVHEDTIKRMVRERKFLALPGVERNARKRLPRCLDSIDVNVYSRRRFRPRFEQGIRVTSVSATIIKPITPVNVIHNAPHAIAHVKRMGS